MEKPFLFVYQFFRKSRAAFWVFLAVLFIAMSWMASSVRFEEDITRFFPNDRRAENMNYIFQHSKLSEKLVVMVSIRDSALKADADKLVSYSDTLVPRIERRLSAHLKGVRSKVDDSGLLNAVELLQRNLPIYLSSSDYGRMDSLADPVIARRVLLENYKQLISPSGVVMKRGIL